jgi:hypothetical protein
MGVLGDPGTTAPATWIDAGAGPVPSLADGSLAVGKDGAMALVWSDGATLHATRYHPTSARWDPPAPLLSDDVQRLATAAALSPTGALEISAVRVNPASTAVASPALDLEVLHVPALRP